MTYGQVFCRMCTQLPDSLVSILTQQQELGLVVSMAAAHATNTHQLLVTYECVLHRSI
jgi:hypothetical protein